MEHAPTPEGFRRMPTGVSGFDDITDGGLARRRVTLVLGGPVPEDDLRMQVLASRAGLMGTLRLEKENEN